MTEAELITAIAAETDHTKVTVRTLMRVMADEMTAALRRGEEVTLPGMGKLKPVSKPARQGCNPKTGEPLTIPAKHTAKFSPSKGLLEALEQNQAR
jgi:DNA-binding protein HU-beta